MIDLCISNKGLIRRHKFYGTARHPRWPESSRRYSYSAPPREFLRKAFVQRYSVGVDSKLVQRHYEGIDSKSVVHMPQGKQPVMVVAVIGKRKLGAPFLLNSYIKFQ